MQQAKLQHYTGELLAWYLRGVGVLHAPCIQQQCAVEAAKVWEGERGGAACSLWGAHLRTLGTE